MLRFATVIVTPGRWQARANDHLHKIIYTLEWHEDTAHGMTQSTIFALVLLPGMDGTGELFAPFVAALKREFKVVVVRYPTNEPLGYAELEAIARGKLFQQTSRSSYWVNHFQAPSPFR